MIDLTVAERLAKNQGKIIRWIVLCTFINVSVTIICRVF